MHSFQLSGLAEASFQPYFDQSDEQLRGQEIRRVRASTSTGFPCRISLEDAREGEELLLLPYCHHPVDSPYRASGPIYVRKGATRAILAPDLVPDYVQRRMLADPALAYVQLHNALPGCFSCTATRVPPD